MLCISLGSARLKAELVPYRRLRPLPEMSAVAHEPWMNALSWRPKIGMLKLRMPEHAGVASEGAEHADRNLTESIKIGRGSTDLG
jgi:hypothetical protein